MRGFRDGMASLETKIAAVCVPKNHSNIRFFGFLVVLAIVSNGFECLSIGTHPQRVLLI